MSYENEERNMLTRWWFAMPNAWRELIQWIVGINFAIANLIFWLWVLK